MALVNKSNAVLRGCKTTEEFYSKLYNELQTAWNNYKELETEESKKVFFKFLNNWRSEVIIAERILEGQSDLQLLECYCHEIITTKDEALKQLRVIATTTINAYESNGKKYRAGEFKSLSDYLNFRNMIEANAEFLPNKHMLGMA